MMVPVNVGLASFGMSGQVFHAPLLHTDKAFCLHSVVERSQNKCAEKYPEVKVLRSFEALLEEDKIELIVVNTPNDTHLPYVTAALQAGKHVVVEKPAANTVEAFDQMAAIAESTGKSLIVFQNRRWDGDFLTVKNVIESTVLGPLVNYEAHFDRFRNYVEPNTWKEESGPGSGILFNLGSHMIDQALLLFGMPLEVNAYLAATRPNAKIHDQYDILLIYNKLLVTLKASYLVREPGPRYILHGIDGSFVKYGIDPQELALKEGKLPIGTHWGEDQPQYYGLLHAHVNGKLQRQRIPTFPGDYPQFYKKVYEHLREGKPAPVTIHQARNTQVIMEACLISNREKRRVKI